MEKIKETSIENKILRINLDGNWSSTDFSNMFNSLTLLYQLFSELDRIDYLESQLYKAIPNSTISENIINLNGKLYKKLNFPDTFENAKTFRSEYYMDYLLAQSQITQKKSKINDLQIKQIKYASPGFSDVVGLGKIIENMIDLIKHYIPNKNQKLENEKTQLDIIEKKIRMLNSIGYSEKEIRKFLDIRNHTISNLKELSMLDKVISFELRNSEN
jgi:hypothetical protein